jgi:hypothetical protein
MDLDVIFRPLAEPNWVEAKGQAPVTPDSLVVFVVSKLGPGPHYPLAVVRREGGLDSLEAIHGRDVLAAIQGTIAVFSDPANHIGIQSELSLTAQFYQDARGALPPTELSNTPAWMRKAVTLEGDGGLREFPFISTCLMLGVAFDRKRGVGLPALQAPLGTVFRDTNMEYAMTVVDISDLDEIRYGIVAFRTTIMIYVSGITEDPDDDWGDEDPWGRRDFKLEENRTREPLSAAAYMAKFQFDQYEPYAVLHESCNDLLDELSRVGIIDALLWIGYGLAMLPSPFHLQLQGPLLQRIRH